MEPKDINRFWSKVIKQDSGCWEWTGTIEYGYGRFSVHRNNVKKNWQAHRFAYTLLKGEIPKGLQSDHLCRNRKCVNPDHIEIVTPLVNTLRSLGVTAANSKKTHCKYGHEFTPENTSIYGKGSHHKYRACRTCHREWWRQHRSKSGRFTNAM